MSTTEGKLTVKDLAARAKVEPKILRRLLRKSFGGGSRKTYVWEPKDPQVEEIIKAAQPKPKEEPKPKAEKKTKGQKAAEAAPGTSAEEAGKTETGES